MLHDAAPAPFPDSLIMPTWSPALMAPALKAATKLTWRGAIQGGEGGEGGGEGGTGGHGAAEGRRAWAGAPSGHDACIKAACLVSTGRYGRQKEGSPPTALPLELSGQVEPAQPTPCPCSLSKPLSKALCVCWPLTVSAVGQQQQVSLTHTRSAQGRANPFPPLPQLPPAPPRPCAFSLHLHLLAFVPSSARLASSTADGSPSAACSDTAASCGVREVSGQAGRQAGSRAVNTRGKRERG